MTKFVPKRRLFSLRMPHGTERVARPAKAKNVIVENGKLVSVHYNALISSIKFLLNFSWTYNTPPDSPRLAIGQYNDIIQDIDIYAIQSIEGTVPIEKENLKSN